MKSSTKHYLGFLYFALAIGGLYWSQFFTSFLFWLALTGGIVSLCFFLRYLITAFSRLETERIDNTTILAGALGISLLTMEGLILAYAQLSIMDLDTALPRNPPLLVAGAYDEQAHAAMKSRHGVISMPDSWARKSIKNSNNFYWHGALHELDDNKMRRQRSFPSARADTLRIMVVGDSLTYGVGIEKKFTYPAILQRLLSTEFRVEVLNLGISGYQSEDTLENIKKFLPKLEPDLLIYGVCLNDYLPSGRGQSASDDWALPLPVAWKDFFIQRTRVAQLARDAYHQLLLQTDLRLDFLDDILLDFEGYQGRFSRDVTEMARFAKKNETPFISMVLHQSPATSGRVHAIITATEAHLAAAGANPVTINPYLIAYQDQVLRVSQWEEHPNELANALFASMLVPAVTEAVDLSAYQLR